MDGDLRVGWTPPPCGLHRRYPVGIPWVVCELEFCLLVVRRESEEAAQVPQPPRLIRGTVIPHSASLWFPGARRERLYRPPPVHLSGLTCGRVLLESVHELAATADVRQVPQRKEAIVHSVITPSAATR